MSQPILKEPIQWQLLDPEGALWDTEPGAQADASITANHANATLRYCSNRVFHSNQPWPSSHIKGRQHKDSSEDATARCYHMGQNMLQYSYFYFQCKLRHRRFEALLK